VVSVTPGADFRASTPRPLFGGRYAPGTVTNWDVSPDGQQFVMVRSTDASLPGIPMHVVLNWFDQLRAQRR